MIDLNNKIFVLIISFVLIFLFSAAFSNCDLFAGKTAQGFAEKQHSVERRNQQENNSHDELGKQLPLWSCIPFAGI